MKVKELIKLLEKCFDPEIEIIVTGRGEDLKIVGAYVHEEYVSARNPEWVPEEFVIEAEPVGLWALERRLKFKSVESRWECHLTFDSKEEAERRLQDCTVGGKAKGGGMITDWRVRRVT